MKNWNKILFFNLLFNFRGWNNGNDVNGCLGDYRFFVIWYDVWVLFSVIYGGFFYMKYWRGLVIKIVE